MAAVFLVHSANNTGISSFPLVCFGGRLILRTIVDDDNLNIGGKIASLKDRGNAVVHILGSIVRGNAECNNFMHGRR